jgi:hypothetical protein
MNLFDRWNNVTRTDFQQYSSTRAAVLGQMAFPSVAARALTCWRFGTSTNTSSAD